MPGIVCTNLLVAPGQRFSIKCDILSGAKSPKVKLDTKPLFTQSTRDLLLWSFAINLGKSKDDLIMHFNPRFDAHGDIRTIVCNSKSKGQWGKEHRESNFPFQEGSTAEMFFTHDKNELTVTLPGNHQFKVPNSAALEGIEYACVEGDIDFKGISLV